MSDSPLGPYPVSGNLFYLGPLSPAVLVLVLSLLFLGLGVEWCIFCFEILSRSVNIMNGRI